jgi:hypothetical protein
MKNWHSLKILLPVLFLAIMALGAQAAVETIFSGPEGQTLSGPRCGIHEPTQEELDLNAQQIEDFLRSGGFTPRKAIVNIPVAVHVVCHDNGYGNISNAAIDNQLDVLNDAYNQHGYMFTLASIDRTYNTTWSTHSYNTTAEVQMKQALNISPATTLNLYFCDIGDDLLGYAYFPHYFPENYYRHGVVCLWGTVPGGWASPYNQGDTATHEVGHFLGLYHTFQGGCFGSGDYVADTPPEATAAYGCPEGRDTCSGGGVDPIHNFMNYVDDYCMWEFTNGQKARMDQQMALYRPTMFANTVSELHVEVISANGTVPVSIFSVPNGSGEPLNAAQASNCPDPASTVDATITVRLTNESGDPVSGFPADKITVAAQFGGWNQCPDNVLYADGPTNASGETTISGALHAGGASGAGELMLVQVDDPDLASTTYPGGLAGLQYWVNSPDFDGNLAVDLADVVPFAQDYFGTYEYRSDFYWDCSILLGDVGRMSQGLGSACPSKKAAPLLAAGGNLGLVFGNESGQPARDLLPGEELDAYLVISGAAASAGVQAFDASVRASNNVRILEQEVLGQGLNLSSGSSFTVGFDHTRSGNEQVALARLRLTVTDEAPAHFWVAGTSGLPAVVVGGEMLAVNPVSGDAEAPVAALNDKNFTVGQGPAARLALSISPNPFNPMTNIKFNVVREGRASVTVYDVSGRAVATLLDGFVGSGERNLTWDASNHPSGLYFCKLQVGDIVEIQKLTLVK